MSPMVRLPLKIEHALLGFLREKPMHGYEIHRRLAAADGPGMAWRLKQSQVYALLGKLAAEGYLTSQMAASGSGRSRRVFRLTVRGRQALLRWIGSPVQHGREIRQDFLLKLYFALREGPEAARRLLSCQSDACREWLQALRRPPSSAETTYDNLVRRYRAGQIEAALAWLSECRRAVAPRRRDTQ